MRPLPNPPALEARYRAYELELARRQAGMREPERRNHLAEAAQLKEQMIPPAVDYGAQP